MKRIIGGSMQRQSIDEYFLNPGELIFSKKPIVIKTVLGSCVAVILHDKEKKIGAMCHYLLPEAPSDAQSSTKYGDVAIYTLLYKFLKENKCTVYEFRFEGCKEFPAMHLPRFKERLFTTFMNYARCPIIFNIIEQLKVETNFKKAN